MPVMDGLTATRAIREWEKVNNRAPTPIIALTAAALKGDREKCVAAGCTAYLTKPIKQLVLLQAIIEHCSAAFSLAATQDQLAKARPVREPVKDILLYLKNRRENVTVLLEALEHGDFETVEFLGHGMRGSGGMFGFQRITDIGAGLELAAGRADINSARQWTGELSSYLDQTDILPTDAP